MTKAQHAFALALLLPSLPFALVGIGLRATGSALVWATGRYAAWVDETVEGQRAKGAPDA